MIDKKIADDEENINAFYDMRLRLLIDLSSMAEGNNGDDKPAIIYLEDDAAVADADAPGVAAS